MSPLRLHKKWMSFIFILLPFVILVACNTTANVTDTPDTPEALPSEIATPEPYPEELAIERDIAFGSGPFIYTDTQTGLADLSSYKATFTIAFDGSLNGQPETWSKTYVMLATNAPVARQWTIGKSDGTSYYLASINGMEYEQSSEDGCHLLKRGNSLLF